MVEMLQTTRAFGEAKSPEDKRRRFCKHRPKRFWLMALREFESSSLSLKDFCAERGLPISTFHGQRRRLHSAKASPQKSPKAASKPQPRFLPVYVTSRETAPEQPDTPLRQQPLSKKRTKNSLDHFSESPSGLSLQINNSLKVSIHRDFHGPTLQRLVHMFLPKESATC